MKNCVIEKTIQEYLQEHWRTIFPRFQLIGANAPIYGCFSQKRIGLADFIFKRGKIYYIAELKYSDQDACDLWESLKALGYAKAYEFQIRHKTKPVVIIRKELITNDIRPIFYKLGINLILISRDNQGFFFEYDFD